MDTTHTDQSWSELYRDETISCIEKCPFSGWINHNAWRQSISSYSWRNPQPDSSSFFAKNIRILSSWHLLLSRYELPCRIYLHQNPSRRKHLQNIRVPDASKIPLNLHKLILSSQAENVSILKTLSHFSSIDKLALQKTIDFSLVLYSLMDHNSFCF